MQRTIEQLSQLNGRVYVFLADEATGRAFLRQAEDEGFTFGDGVRPTERRCTRIMAVNHSRTLNYVGANGHIAFGAGARTVNGERLLRVDFAKYAAVDRAYLMKQ